MTRAADFGQVMYCFHPHLCWSYVFEWFRVLCGTQLLCNSNWEKHDKSSMTVAQAIKKHLESAIVAKTGGTLQGLKRVQDLVSSASGFAAMHKVAFRIL